MHETYPESPNLIRFCEPAKISVEFSSTLAEGILDATQNLHRRPGGTTALRIRDWLAGRNDLEVITLPEELRKDPAARIKALQDANIVLLCLPDDAAKEAAAWLADSLVRG